MIKVADVSLFSPESKKRFAPGVIRPVGDGASGDAEPEPPLDPIRMSISILYAIFLDASTNCIHHLSPAYLLDQPASMS